MPACALSIVCISGGRRSVPYVFLYCSRMNSLRQGPSLNLELTDQLAKSLRAGGIGNVVVSFYVGTRDLNSCPHACAARTLSTEQSPSPIVLSCITAMVIATILSLMDDISRLVHIVQSEP